MNALLEAVTANVPLIIHSLIAWIILNSILEFVLGVITARSHAPARRCRIVMPSGEIIEIESSNLQMNEVLADARKMNSFDKNKAA